MAIPSYLGARRDARQPEIQPVDLPSNVVVDRLTTLAPRRPRYLEHLRSFENPRRNRFRISAVRDFPATSRLLRVEGTSVEMVDGVLVYNLSPEKEDDNLMVAKKLQNVVYGADDSKETIAGDSCAVCLDDFQRGAELKKMPNCNHAFHGACLRRWLDVKKTCPTCRSEL